MTPKIERLVKSLRGWEPECFTTDRLKKILKRTSFKLLGAGMYGVALDMGNCVLKIFNADDTAYLDFLDFCDKVESPYLPVILWDKQINSTLWAVVLEKLIPLTDDPDNVLEDELDDEFPLFYQIKKYIGRNQFGRKFSRLHFVDRDLCALLDLLEEERIEQKHYQDLHSGNVMLRAGEQMVITDPWC